MMKEFNIIDEEGHTQCGQCPFETCICEQIDCAHYDWSQMRFNNSN